MTANLFLKKYLEQLQVKFRKEKYFHLKIPYDLYK